MGNLGPALEAYGRAQTLLVFLLSEGPGFVASAGAGPAAETAEKNAAGAAFKAVEACTCAMGKQSEAGTALKAVEAGAAPTPGFSARGRVARFAGAISSRQSACAAAAGAVTSNVSSRSSVKMSSSSVAAVPSASPKTGTAA